MQYTAYIVCTTNHLYQQVTSNKFGIQGMVATLKEQFPDITLKGWTTVVICTDRVHSPNRSMYILDSKLEVSEHYTLEEIATRLGYSVLNLQHNPEQSMAFWRWYNAKDHEKHKYLRLYNGPNGRLIESSSFVGYPNQF
jgi:hypothetical protein